MQPSGSFYSSGSQRTICGHVSYVYFIIQSKRENKVTWAGGGVGPDKGQRQGWRVEGDVERERTGGSINSWSIIRSSFSAAYTSPVRCLPKDSQHIQMSQSTACIVQRHAHTTTHTHACLLCKSRSVEWSRVPSEPYPVRSRYHVAQDAPGPSSSAT